MTRLRRRRRTSTWLPLVLLLAVALTVAAARRGGLRGSDGQPVTADDVIFTLDAIYDPRVLTRVRDTLQVGGKPLRYAKVDDGTVRFTLPSTFGAFLATLEFSILPRHKLAAA